MPGHTPKSPRPAAHSGIRLDGAVPVPQAERSHLGSYIIGFILSIALTLIAYAMVVSQLYAAATIVTVILLLAIVQLLVQLIFFLHLDRAVRAPWNIIMLLFMGMVVAIVVFGSLWIMQNLNYHMKSPAQQDEYLLDNEDL